MTISRKALPFVIGALVLASVLSSCGESEATSISTQGQAVEAAETAGQVVNWQSLGCPEPEALAVPSSAALEEDAGLAFGSLAAEYGLSDDEALRRLRLQTVMGERLQQLRRAESGRVARVAFQHEPYYAGVVTLTGDSPVSEASRAILCETPELEIHFGARFTEAELVGEINRLAPLVHARFGNEVPSMGPTEGQLFFDTRFDAIAAELDAFLADETEYPYTIGSLGLPPLELDGTVPFPLLDTTGLPSSGVGLDGIVTIEGPCAYLNESMLLILPARETTFDIATGALDMGSGAVFSGDMVTGGGSQYRQPLSELDQPPDPSCRTEGDAFLVGLAPLDPQATPAPLPPPTPGVN